MREKSLAWSERFAFGIDAIDDQHRRLFDYLERLDASLRRGEGWLALRELLDEVAHWADLHFAVEEALMEIMGYPGAAAHIEGHRRFKAALDGYRTQAVTDSIAHQTSELLYGWLTEHIDGDDRKYAEYFRQRLGPGAG
ncbi:MAG: hemerythrin family protein [Azonexus sp.]|jgi:hemerythrin|nr:hemerythrin family protein [Betaproteobacteria bacterium]MBP6036123.1 hemerythrin family protein [Azonexus sp.]MBP6906646.1 hemerythrin family protein [Azonexus sp.]